MYQSCIGVFQANISPVCLKGASHGDVSFKHTEHTFWLYVRAYLRCFADWFPSGNVFCLLERGVSLRRFFLAHRTCVLMGNNEGALL